MTPKTVCCGLVIATGAALLPMGEAHAVLSVLVTDAGSSQTTWTFSSTPGSTAINNGTFTTTAFNVPNAFFNLTNSPYTTIDNTLFNAVGGAASITIGSDTSSISQLYIDLDSGTGSDDFGVAGGTSFSYSTGEAVSWTGSLLMPIAFSNLTPGIYGPATNNAGIGSGLPQDITLTISSATPVPLESDALPILGSVAFLGAGVWFKRRRAQAKANLNFLSSSQAAE